MACSCLGASCAGERSTLLLRASGDRRGELDERPNRRSLGALGRERTVFLEPRRAGDIEVRPLRFRLDRGIDERGAEDRAAEPSAAVLEIGHAALPVVTGP